MKVLYFAQAGEAAGCREEHWEIRSPLTLDEFWREAVSRHPRLTRFRDQCRVASGMSYLLAGERIEPQQETAVIPPVSGG
ncbi:MAG: MoaD/ThiS family protein [Verrucomicrobiaceae bacterium]|nr:MAG: MoaD/ThiS family protein [Verrucomicrobiaceae bacterium]